MGSLWHSTVRLPRFPKLHGDIKTDVLIIGGDMVGILTAYFLHQQGVAYMLAEKGRICGGTTGNTTAKITAQHGFCYQKLLAKCGPGTVKAYYTANMSAEEQYAALCEKIDCDFERKDNYVYSDSDVQRIENELEALEKIGVKAFFSQKLSLPFETAGEVKFADQAQFHPLKFVAEIAKGLHIYENTFVREMIGNTAVTDAGKIAADHVIVTTHFPFINKHGSYFLKLYQRRSYVIALKDALQVNGMYLDESREGFSFRNYGDLLLLGGGAHRTGKEGGNFEALRFFAKLHCPGASEQYAWAAQDCMSLDDVPYIGSYGKNTHNLYTASGFNKWG